MKIHLYHDTHYENWDWTNSTDQGIGGSETHTTEMAWRLARRGHEVTVYAPTPFTDTRTWRGTNWKRFEQANFTQPGLWVIYRHPAILEKFKASHPDQEVWFMAQDEWYTSWKAEHSDRIDRFLALSLVHARACITNQPNLNGKVWVTSNGLKADLIRAVEAEGPIARYPHRLMYASSPDRGLAHLLPIFKKVREYVPDAELHCFYGFDNIDKLIKYQPRFLKYQKVKAEIMKLLNQPGVSWHGRVSQRDLYLEWMKSGIWCYPTNFTETSCITCMEAQAMGAIPITNPIWALSENVKHGTFIDGDAYGDPLTKARYVAEIVRWMTQPELQDQVRPQMMRWARGQFNWERWVDQWENFFRPTPLNPLPHTQFAFQHQHAIGRILNIGCAEDPSNFKSRGAVNLDVQTIHPIFHTPYQVDILADARKLPEDLKARFDTVVVGDLMEHLTDSDAVQILSEAKSCLRNGGYIIVTYPNDNRSREEQHPHGQMDNHYASGVSCYHHGRTLEEFSKLVEQVGMTVRKSQVIDYTHVEGYGLICC